jgi:hypothetical protein
MADAEQVLGLGLRFPNFLMFLMIYFLQIFEILVNFSGFSNV